MQAAATEVSEVTTTLARREDIADGTSAFHFAKPPGFTFKPGQAIDLVLPGGGAGDDAKHAFSIVSAPFEDELVVATRMRDSAYKCTLGSLPPGAPVVVDGPFGSLTLHGNRSRGAVLIAGGIGITPFMSILRHAARDPLARPLALVYSNRRPEDAAFLDELQRLEKTLVGFKLVATMTGMENSSRPWIGKAGFVDAALIKEVGSWVPAPIYYVAGPPAMVSAMRKMLNEAGVDDDDIRSEDFYGYS